MSGRSASYPVPHDSALKMHMPPASELLAVWECGLGQSLVQRALWLLSAACPDMSLDALAQLSIGQRDARLLELREWLFGSSLVSVAVCPRCREQLELAFDMSDVRVSE